MLHIYFNRIATDSLNCLNEFNENCITGPPQILLRKVYDKVNNGLDGRCNDKEKSAEFIDNIKCLDTEQKVETVRMCSDKHIKLLELVSKLDFARRFGPTCCAFQAFKTCSLDSMRTVCGEEEANFFESLLLEFVSTDTCDTNH